MKGVLIVVRDNCYDSYKGEKAPLPIAKPDLSGTDPKVQLERLSTYKEELRSALSENGKHLELLRIESRVGKHGFFDTSSIEEQRNQLKKEMKSLRKELKHAAAAYDILNGRQLSQLQLNLLQAGLSGIITSATILIAQVTEPGLGHERIILGGLVMGIGFGLTFSLLIVEKINEKLKSKVPIKSLA